MWLSQFIGKLTQQLFNDTPAENEQNIIMDGIATRIGRAIDNNENFHVYIVLPVHPEGMLNADSTMHMIHLAMQTIYNGQDSLIKRIQKAMCAKRLRSMGVVSRAEAEQMVYNSKIRNQQILSERGGAVSQDFLTSTPQSSLLRGLNQKEEELDPDFITEDWSKYVTLLNLRNWDKLGGGLFGFHSKVVTEQIYVHSKLIIVDDNIAIIGSCNINDRSMLGGRDSELAAIVRGGETKSVALNGKQARTISKTVQEFRIKLWRKIFALDLQNPKESRVQPATCLEPFLEKPAAPETVKAIREKAETNTKIYNTAFDFIPQNESPVQQEQPQLNKGLYPKVSLNYYPLGCSIWPLWFYNDPDDHLKGGELKGQMPFQEEFWQSPLKKYRKPKGIIEGFITLLPIKWTMGEGNLSYTSNTTLARNEPSPYDYPTQRTLASIDPKKEEDPIISAQQSSNKQDNNA